LLVKKFPIEFNLEEFCVRVESTANAAMVMVAAVTESGAEADGTFAILQRTRCNASRCNVMAVMVRAAATALAMV